MAKQKIVVKEFIADFRSGMDDSDLREKYALTRRQLDKTLEKLVGLGKLEITDFDDEGMTFEPTMELAGTCPNCGALMLADTPHCPICEVTVHEGGSSTRPKAPPPSVEPPPPPEPPDPKTVIQRIRKEVSAFTPSETLTEEATSREEHLSGDFPVNESAEAPSPSKRRVSPVLGAACVALLLIVVGAGAAVFTNVIPLERLWPEPPTVKREGPSRPSTPPKAAPTRAAKTQQPAAPADQVRVAKKAPTYPTTAVEPDSARIAQPRPAPSKSEPAKPAESPLPSAPKAGETRAPTVSEQPVEEALPSAETEPRVAVRQPSGAPATTNMPQTGTKPQSPRPPEAAEEAEGPMETAKLAPESPRIKAVESPDAEQAPISETVDEPPATNTSEIASAAPPKAPIPPFPSRGVETAEPENSEQSSPSTDTTALREVPSPSPRPVERPDRTDSLDRKAGARALIEAARHGDVDRIESLIAHGADVNAVDESGNTALMVAAGSGRIEAVQALMRRGADVSLKNKKGISALGWAYNPLPGDYVPLRVRRRIVQLLKGSR